MKPECLVHGTVRKVFSNWRNSCYVNVDAANAAEVELNQYASSSSSFTSVSGMHLTNVLSPGNVRILQNAIRRYIVKRKLYRITIGMLNLVVSTSSTRVVHTELLP